MKKVLYLLLLIPIVIACSDSSDDEVTPDNTNNEAYKAAEGYYNSTLKSVITANCVSCHTGHHSQSNGSNYGVLSNAINNASGMYNQVNSGNMPKDAEKLPQDDIDKFEEFKKLVDAIP